MNEDENIDDLDSSITSRYGALMDTNQNVIEKCRRQALECNRLIDDLSDSIMLLAELRDLHIRLGQRLSETLSNILALEWDLQDEDEEEEEEEEE